MTVGYVQPQINTTNAWALAYSIIIGTDVSIENIKIGFSLQVTQKLFLESRYQAVIGTVGLKRP